MLKAFSQKVIGLGLIAAFLGLVVWELVLQQNPDKTTIWNYQFNTGVAVFYFLAFAIAMWRLRAFRKNQPERRVFRYFGLAGLCWGIAFMIWTYYNVVLQVKVPYPSVADVFFVPAYPLLGLALLDLHETYHSRIQLRVVRDSIVIVFVSAIVILTVLNRPDLSPDLGLSKNILNVFYSLGDVMLVAVALIELRTGQAKKHRGLYLLALFFLLQAGADFLFAYHNNAEVYWNGELADLLFGASGFIFALMLVQNKLFKRMK